MAANLKTSGNPYDPMTMAIPKGLNRDQLEKLEASAFAYISERQFHRSFMLPPNHEIGRTLPIRVTYADAGYSPEKKLANAEDVPVLLWCGGMLGGRYNTVLYAREALKHRLRLIAIDKPGIGGSDNVPLKQRIQTWLDAVSTLLEKLHIKHVSLVAHSNGTIYALQTVLRRREILHPDRPYVVLLAPWIPPRFTKKWQLRFLGYLPSSILRSYHQLAIFAHEFIAPSLEFSTDITSRAIGALRGSRLKVEKRRSLLSEDLVKTVYWAIVMNAITSSVYHERIEGTSDEILLCLQKGIDWGTFEDYSRLVNQIRNRENPTSGEPSHGRRVWERPCWDRLLIHTYFAVNDELCSLEGRDWFSNCCGGEGIAYESEDINADHNTILLLDNGVIPGVLQTVSQSPPDESFLLGEEYSDPLAMVLSKFDEFVLTAPSPSHPTRKSSRWVSLWKSLSMSSLCKSLLGTRPSRGSPTTNGKP